MIALRDEMATILGYSSYADYELDDQMVGSVARAEQFLNDLLKAAQVKEEQEMIEMLSLDVKNITRLPGNKIMPWDRLYLKDQYKKRIFSFDEQEVAAYFPVEKTIEGLLSIYEQFFALSFKQIPFKCPWSSDVTMIAVHDKDSGTLLGYLMLDLYPRPNKFSHACLMSIIPATFYQDGTPNSAVSMVIANFPRSTPEKPALLKYSDVSTFFHEFGHALHEIIGRTKQASMAGLRTKKDFIELPSQILEEWLYDREILKKVSAHYQTGKSLPDSLIDAIIALKKFGSGGYLSRQCFFAFTSLDYYKAGAVKDIDAVLKADYEKTAKFNAYSPQDHDYAAFGHLTSYGARVYSYMWSKVFAFDIFEQIKKEGLLNPAMGSRYAQAILVPGGTKDPNQMLREFLGREPNQEAFLKGLGLK
jgi:thimet oligopeptidase